MTDVVSTMLRGARPDDLSGIVDLDALRSGERKPAYWRKVLDDYAQGGASGGRVALVAEVAPAQARQAEEGRHVCGFLFGEVRAWEFGSEPCGWIFSVSVHPDHERHGLATRLCAEAAKRFGDLGVGLVRTMVRRDDVPMLALFRSMGFRAGPFSELETRVPVAARKKEGAA